MRSGLSTRPETTVFLPLDSLTPTIRLRSTIESRIENETPDSASAFARAGNEIIGIDLGTTNSCVAVMEGKVSDERRRQGGKETG